MAQQNHVFQESQLQQTLESWALELAYGKTCHKVEAVCESERARQLRVQILLLEDKNDELQSRLAQDDERIDSWERHSQEVQDDVKACSAELKSAQSDLRVKSRENETLKAELNSLQGVTMDSTKLLTEKLTLARELSCLRPEIDHLRSQTASHQCLLAEKLALQRKLSTMQVELETEKRSIQRAMAKEDKLQAGDARLESQIETLQADLTKERRDRQKAECEAQKTSTESENRKAALESRLDAFRNKLRTTKVQLKEAQTALEAAQATAIAASCRSLSSKPTMSLAKNSRKRAAAQMNADTMIGTPGDIPAAKKNKRASTLVGEKSTFSITPFLNRTGSVAPESPLSNNGGSDREEEIGFGDHVSGDSNRKVPGKVKPVSRGLKLIKGAVQAKKGGILENAKSSRVNSKPPPGRNRKAAAMLEQVAEEENIEIDRVTIPVPEAASSKALSNDTVNQGAEMKKKKRKMLGGGLGKTLFDEDEGDILKRDGGMSGDDRGFGMLGRGRLGGSRFGPSGTSISTFGAISPRKER